MGREGGRNGENEKGREWNVGDRGIKKGCFGLKEVAGNGCYGGHGTFRADELK